MSDIKILNIFVSREIQVSSSTLKIELLSANGRADLIRSSITLETGSDTSLVKASVVHDATYKVNIKTQYICAQYIPLYNVLVTGDTKGNLFLFDYSIESIGEGKQV